MRQKCANMEKSNHIGTAIPQSDAELEDLLKRSIKVETEKHKRKRNPWVYKWQYDQIEDEKAVYKALAIAGWSAFGLTGLLLLLEVTFKIFS